MEEINEFKINIGDFVVNNNTHEISKCNDESDFIEMNESSVIWSKFIFND